MVIDPQSALRFIDGWKALLLQAAGTKQPPPTGRALNALLVQSRAAVAAEPALLDAAAAALERDGRSVDADVLGAARTLRLDHWIYLRDTTGHSVFLDSRARAAYAVLGLTDRLRDIIGDSGAIVRTGVVEFAGRYVCDGLMSELVWLGTNMRRELNDELARLRANGAFHARPGATPAAGADAAAGRSASGRAGGRAAARRRRGAARLRLRLPSASARSA